MKVMLCVLLLVCRTSAQNDPRVRTSLGNIRGSYMKSRLGKVIYSFRGIPYAKPPVGALRFQPPQPVAPWDGTLDATKDGPSCPPTASIIDLPTSEDCLSLNVYTTKLPKLSPLRPVLVFFHPGAWFNITADSRVFGPQYLMDKDIVLVTVNYRLGVLGFASTNDNVIQGNFGLKDQVASLRWVKQNIAAFSGDPDSVTFSGCSAGSASAMLHMVSPMSRGLFHRVIGSSGSAFALWALRKNPFTYAQRLAQLFDCPADTSQQIKDCLMNQDAQLLADSIFRLNEWGYYPDVIFGPVIETDTESDRFLVEYPINSFRSGKFEQVPMYIGMTKDELAWRSNRILSNETLAEQINTQTDYVFPIVFSYERNTTRSRNISRTLRDLYFQDRPIDNSTVDELAKMFRDGVVGYGEDLASKVISTYSKAPLWYYRFSYPGRYSWITKDNSTIPYGVVHEDDLIYLFCISALFPCFNSSDPEGFMVDTLTTLWTNFVKTGNPTPRRSQALQNVIWEPFTAKNLKYLDIGSDLKMKSGLYQDTLPVWDKLLYNQLF